MSIIKASKSRQKTEESIALQVELELELKRIEEAKARDREQLLQAENDKRKREIKSARITNAQVARQRNIAHRKALQEAGEGRFFVYLRSFDKSLVDEFRALGFRISTVIQDREIITTGLYKHWSIETDHFRPVDHSQLLDPLIRFVMIAVVKAWRSRENNINEIRGIAETLLAEYLKDLKNRDYRQLWKRIDRLCNLDSDDRHAEMFLSDFLSDRSEYLQIKKKLTDSVLNITVSVDTEEQFFEILKTIRRTLKFDAFREDQNRELMVLAEELSMRVVDALSTLPDDGLSLSWWSSLYIQTARHKTLAEQLFWLASEDGQAFLARLGEEVEFCADSGGSALELSLARDTDEFQMTEVVQSYLKLQGYDVVRKREIENQITLRISWN